MEIKCPGCGYENFVSFDGLKPDRLCYVCPDCGYIAFFNDDNVEFFRSKYFALSKFDKEISDLEAAIALIEDNDNSEELVSDYQNQLKVLIEKRKIVSSIVDELKEA